MALFVHVLNVLWNAQIEWVAVLKLTEMISESTTTFRKETSGIIPSLLPQNICLRKFGSTSENLDHWAGGEVLLSMKSSWTFLDAMCFLMIRELKPFEVIIEKWYSEEHLRQVLGYCCADYWFTFLVSTFDNSFI